MTRSQLHRNDARLVVLLAIGPVVLNSDVLTASDISLVSTVASVMAYGFMPRRWPIGLATLPLLGASIVSEYRWTLVLMALCVLLAAGAEGLRLVPSSALVRPAARVASLLSIVFVQTVFFITDLPGKPVLLAGGALVAVTALDVLSSPRLDELDRRIGAIAAGWSARWRHRTLLRRGVAMAPLVVALLAGVIAGLVAWHARRPVFYDDVGITMRYAERIADGLGFTYNDGDRTNGASAPLYTLMLSLFGLFGLSVPAVVQAVAVSCYSAAVGLVAWIGTRVGGVLTGVLAATVLFLSDDFELQAMSGMESGFAVVLGLATIALLVDRRDLLAGLVLGLAVVNKLDAGLLVVAVAGALFLVERRVPWRLILASVATSLPWFVFSLAYFGTIIPNSASQKLGDVRSQDSDWTRTWILDAFRGDVALPLIALAVAAVVVAATVSTVDERAKLGVIACGSWSLLHLVAFSFVDLGDTYPWYRTAVVPGVALAGSWLVVWTLRNLASLVPTTALSRTAVAALLVLAIAGPIQVSELKNEFTWQPEDTPGSRIDELRRDAGIYISRHAAPDEVVRTCFGWVAYEASDQNIDEICPLNTRDDPGAPDWLQEMVVPSPEDRGNVPGWELVATFSTEFPEDGTSYVYRATDR